MNAHTQRRSAARLLISGWVLLTVAWIAGNPPFATADESAHYVRAVSLAGGEIVGAPAPEASFPNLQPRQAAIVEQQTRRVTMPARLSPQGWACFIGRPGTSAACLDEQRPTTGPTTELATVGTYQPATYLLPGLAARAAADPASAVTAGRVVAAGLCLLLLGGAVRVSRRAGARPLSYAGVMLATTPMVLFTASSLNPSGAEIAGSIAFFAAALRLGRDEEAPAGVWLLAASAGAVTCLSRTLGPAWVAAGLAVAAAWSGWPRLRAVLRRQPTRVLATFGVLAGATAGNVAFEAVYGPQLDVVLPPTGAQLLRGAGFVTDALVRQSFGVFGYVEVTVPSEFHVLWRLLLVTTLAAALAIARPRQRMVLLATVAAVFVVSLAVEVILMAPTGFHVQGRHLLPAGVLVPILTGEILADRLTRHRRAVAAALYGSSALFHAAAWYTNGRRAAVGVHGSWTFPLSPQWDPVGGWLPWLAVAGAGAILVASAGLGRRRSPAPVDSPAVAPP